MKRLYVAVAVVAGWDSRANAENSAHAALVVPTTSVVPTLRHDVCLTNEQCLNGGKCHVLHSGTQSQDDILDEYNFCSCHAGFGGQRCESYCPLKCQNGGICHATASSGGGSASSHHTGEAIHSMSTLYTCKCMGLWTGTLCDMPYENCIDGSQCFNGGQCRLRNITITVSYCDCPTGFGGSSCQEKVLEVEPEQTRTFVLSKDMLTFLSLGIVVISTAVASALLMALRRRSRDTKYTTVHASEEEGQSVRASGAHPKEERWRNVV